MQSSGLSCMRLGLIRSNSDASLFRGAHRIEHQSPTSKSRPTTAHAALQSQPSPPPSPTKRRSQGRVEMFGALSEPIGGTGLDEDPRIDEQDASELPPLPVESDSLLQALGGPPHTVNGALSGQIHSDEGSAIDEREMTRKLMDVESSFVPEPSPVAHSSGALGVDDTFGGSPVKMARSRENHNDKLPDKENRVDASSVNAASQLSQSPPTPADAYKTPCPVQYRERDDEDSLSLPGVDTSSPEITPSSPAAAAAERTLSRAVCVPSLEDHKMVSMETGFSDGNKSIKEDKDVSDRVILNAQRSGSQASSSRASTVKAPSPPLPRDVGLPPSVNTSHLDSMDADNSVGSSGRSHNRPSFLVNRQASQRSSISSYTNGSAESDITLGADYALQTGGAVPASSSIGSRASMGLSRLPSLGSVASSMSGYSDAPQSFSRLVSGTSAASGLQAERSLERLEEERDRSTSPPATPRPTSSATLGPTDTVIAQHIQNIRVPDTVAKEFREQHRSLSPVKRPGSSNLTSTSTRSKSNLTLKEQNSKIDKLSKENFDLKLKIHFLDQALQDRSDEGVKEMISKNVQYQTDLANEKKESHMLRRTVRDLEKKIKGYEDGLAEARRNPNGSEEEQSRRSSDHADMEQEITYLREQLEYSEVHIEKLQEENLAKEVEKRKLAEYVKAEMWKDLLEAETARREQADEAAQILRAELARVKSETASVSASNHHVKNFPSLHKRHNLSYARSQSGLSDISTSRNGPVSTSSSTLVDQLQHEIAELRRDLGAQTSMLTSRNRERERLQQEIEDLKLIQRRSDGGVRSVAGDSIFERSISRAHQRSNSRASAKTQITQISEAEREDWEKKEASLRDHNAEIRMLNQDLERDNQKLEAELNAHLDLLTEREAECRELQAELEAATEDMQAIQTERDEALRSLDERESYFVKWQEDAIGEVNNLEEENEQHKHQIGELSADLEHRNEDFMALQQEMKTVSGSLVQLEDDRQATQQRLETLEQEVEDAARELEVLDQKLREATQKNQRLEVQQESYHSEISFLREEQEGDKIKIGELEDSLSVAQQTLQDERERMIELEGSLAEERHQCEVVDSKEKQEVQTLLNHLNDQVSTYKEEARSLQSRLSTKQSEATVWKQRLDELEGNLREALGNLNGTRASLVKDITKLQSDLDITMHELETTRSTLVDKDRLLKNRDALLESTGLESRKLSDLLDKERQARKHDQHYVEQAQRSQQDHSRATTKHETRVHEVETARSHDRRKYASLEQQYKDQLLERNNLLLALWYRLSTLCGQEWVQKNSSVDGDNVSIEVMNRNLSGFSKNTIHAVDTIESLIGNFKQRVRSIEKNLYRHFQILEHGLDARIKRMDVLEKAVKERTSRSSSRSEDVARLKAENKTLAAELTFYRHNPHSVPQQQQRPESHRSPSSSQTLAPPTTSRSSMAATLLRHHSTSAVEALANPSSYHNQHQRNSSQQPVALQTPPIRPSEQRWIHRLKELERRLKAEREARLLDRSGARRRLEEGRMENEVLKMQLEREKVRRESVISGGSEASGGVD